MSQTYQVSEEAVKAIVKRSFPRSTCNIEGEFVDVSDLTFAERLKAAIGS